MKRLEYEPIRGDLPQGIATLHIVSGEARFRHHLAPNQGRKRLFAGLVLVVVIVAVAAVCRKPRRQGLTWEQLLAAKAPTALSQNFVEPETRSSADSVLRTQLVVAATAIPIGPSIPPRKIDPILLNVRAYEGAVPGPTLRIKPGDCLELEVVNNLALDPEGRNLSTKEETLRGKVVGWPNSTNIHVHGLHVSPSDHADNIYRRVGPGQAFNYVYKLPEDHYPGTFFYHPHYEGSSSVQVLGGMAGAIVVEDPPETIPTQLGAMRDLIVLLQEVNVESGVLRNYAAVSRVSGSHMPLWASRGGRKKADLQLHFVSANGQFQPVLRIAPGEAVRLRLVHAGVNDHFNITLGSNEIAGKVDGEGGCMLLTLARDGVYLPSPRRQPSVLMGPGSRADLAVQCKGPGMFHLASSGGGDMAYLGTRTNLFEGTLAFISVDGSALDMDLPKELPGPLNMGRLLQDLRQVPEDKVSRYVFEFNQDGKVHPDGGQQAYTWYGINGMQYQPETVMHKVALGRVEEWVIVNQWLGRGCPTAGNATAQPLISEGGVRARRKLDDGLPGSCGEGPGVGWTADTGHPFHLHVNHFQVIQSSWGSESADWEVGDWRDTISVPTPGNVTIRWRADDFTGEAVAHCHIFGHSDTGMMMNFEIIP